MSWAYEIAFYGGPDQRAGLETRLKAGACRTWAGLPGLASFDLYTPADGPVRDPYNNDGAGPLMMLMLDFATRDALAEAVGSGGIGGAAHVLALDVTATGTAFERRFYPVGQDTTPAPLRARFSYVVRYHRPADDEAAFVENYLATHPVTEARLPGIRGIMCYLPLDDVLAGETPRLRSADYMIGNEVVFDDIDTFNTAMASPVRQELRAHYHAFPRFTGANTHYPMIRTRFVG